MWNSSRSRRRNFSRAADSVTVLGHSAARVTPSGSRVEHDWAHIFKVEDGKVTEFREFTDTHAVVQAYFGGDIHSVTVAPSEQTAGLHH